MYHSAFTIYVSLAVGFVVGLIFSSYKQWPRTTVQAGFCLLLLLISLVTDPHGGSKILIFSVKMLIDGALIALLMIYIGRRYILRRPLDHISGSNDTKP